MLPDRSLLIEMWKKSRDSVEHFDRLIGEIRKMTITVNAAFVPLTIHVVQEQNEWEAYLIILGLTANIFSFVMWVLEKHYHLYLVTSAHVASNLEERITDDKLLCLTQMISKVKRKIQHKILGLHFYDVLYFGSMLGGLAVVHQAHASLPLLIILGIVEGLFVLSVLIRQSRHGKGFSKADTSSAFDDQANP